MKSRTFYDTGGCESDWIQSYTDATTVTSAADLKNPAGTSASTLIEVRVPPGATHVLVRNACDDETDTFTTDPIVRVIGYDENGIPMRLDAVAANTGGDALANSASKVNDGTLYWGDVIDLTGFSLQGCKTIWTPVDTAAAYLDGATPVAVPIYVKFVKRY